ncbi:MAG: DUF3810 domain-containing protein [Ruminococcus sp.]|nr:DUF3810 domain-containing protein [Ruminococcus sp.]
MKDESTKAEEKKVPSRAFKVQLIIIMGLLAMCGVLNIVSWKSESFCNFYQGHIYPIWENLYGRMTSLMPFSFGELLIALGVVLIPLAFLALVFFMITGKFGRKRTGKIIGLFYLWVVTFVVLTETLNCFVLYHCPSFAKLGGISESKHTNEELEELGDRIVAQLNELAPQVKRDDQGCFVLTADLDETAKKSMQRLGEEFRYLDGYYVTPKSIYCSFFMSQMDLMGIYFPFSMEANYNNEMFKAKLPATICHELAHTKGFMREDEANFIAFVACDRSDNVEYRYSGYLSALTEVRNRIFVYADEEKMIEFDSAISEQVWKDIDANRSFWQSVEEAEDTVFDSRTVSEVSDKAMETSLHLNGVSDGKQSYGRMVDLMLNYYKDKEFGKVQ